MFLLHKQDNLITYMLKWVSIILTVVSVRSSFQKRCSYFATVLEELGKLPKRIWLSGELLMLIVHTFILTSVSLLLIEFFIGWKRKKSEGLVWRSEVDEREFRIQVDGFFFIEA